MKNVRPLWKRLMTEDKKFEVQEGVEISASPCGCGESLEDNGKIILNRWDDGQWALNHEVCLRTRDEKDIRPKAVEKSKANKSK